LRSARITNSLSFHHFGLENYGKKWLSLEVKGRSTGVSGSSFGFLQDKPETVKGVVISIRGSTTFVGQEENHFLDLEQVLWTPTDSGSSKITGVKTWSFQFDLPADVRVGGKSYTLPPNFSERASAAYIDYKLIVTVRRGMFRVNQTLAVNFSYLPSSTAGVPSTLRTLAYEKGTQLPGPAVDPDGWKTLSPVKFSGTLFGTKEVELESLLSIGTPLCYALGSPIPLMLTISGEEKQALDVVANPISIQLHLVRSIITDNIFRQILARAYFWPTEHGWYRRQFQGELEVSNTLKPSFTFPNFTLQYTLELMPFKATGFTPLLVMQRNEGPLLSEAVTFATKQSAGRPPEVDYNKSRFYHHHPGW
ncbi:hypothetical protein BDQ17DRAFT_1359307, partial [Cyathus striatus]